MKIKDILSAGCAIGAGMIGYNAANHFKGTQKYLVQKVLTTAGAFGIADLVADRVDKHINTTIDDFVKTCSDMVDISNKEDEENGRENVIDITEARAEEES